MLFNLKMCGPLSFRMTRQGLPTHSRNFWFTETSSSTFRLPRFVKSKLHVFKFILVERRNVENEMWETKCGKRNVENEMWKTKCGKRHVKNGMWKTKCEKRNVEDEMWKTKCGK